MDTSEQILVLGIGNTLLTDEAVGVRIVEHIQSMPESSELGLKLLDGGTMGLTLLVDMEDADAMVVIDAAYLGKDPGEMQIFEGAEMDHFLRNRGRNPHDIGLDDMMDGLRLREAVPKNRALVGIQPSDLSVGEHLTPDVAKAVPIAANAIIELIKGWKSDQV